MSNLSDRGTLRGTLQRNSGNYNDLINKPAINGHTLIGNQSGHALGLANEDDIINVEANPLGPATADLHKIFVDDTIYSIPDVIVYGTVSGDIASFDDGGDNKPLKSLKVAINPVQASGTPSPQAPIPISGWTGANIFVRAINIFNENWESGSLDINTGNPTPNADWSRSIDFIAVKPSATYYVRFEGNDSTNNAYIFYYGKNKEFLSQRQGSTGYVVRTMPNNCYYIKVQYKRTIDNVNNYKCAINYPSTDTDYHAYGGATYPITWSDAGTVYGGYIDYERKKLVVNRADYTITSTRNFTQGSEDLISMSLPSEYGTDVIPQCESFEGKTKGSSGGLSANQCRLNVGMTVINFRFSAPKTVDEWKTELENNPIQLILGLVTPIEYDLDEPVPTITTLLGNNNLWSDTGEIEVCVYQRDINIALNKALSQ